MGSGSYSESGYNNYVTTHRVKQKSMRENFSQTRLHPDMDVRRFNKDVRINNTDVPGFVKVCGVRESRVSQEHPNVFSLLIFCDGTGSMGFIPQKLLQEQFPKIMNALYENGIPDPQIAFGMIGDHYSDDVPAQLSQYESNAEKLLPQFQKLYIESGGGGNGGESYLLGWLIGGYHTECDCWYKNHQKGVLITIGDEACHNKVEASALRTMFGYGDGVENMTAKDLLKKAQEQYNVFHFHMTDGSYGSHADTSWKKLLDEEHIICCHSDEVAEKIVKCVLSTYNTDHISESAETENEKQDVPVSTATESAHSTSKHFGIDV